MDKMKIIPRPELKSAVRLSAMDLNKIRFSSKHTVLTPAMLEKFASRGDVDDKVKRK